MKGMASVAQSVPDFESLVVPLMREQRSYFLLAFAIIFLGVVLILGMFVTPIFLPDAENPAKNMITIGGFGLSTMSALPIRNWLSARRRVDYIRHMEQLWRQYAGMSKPPKDELDRLKDLLWKLREQGALGT